MTTIFTNDNNVIIKLLDNHKSSYSFSTRNNHEVLFRQINNYLIQNNIIKNNIIDLGAWIGDNSIPWAKNVKNIIYAIDPSSDNCDYIKQMCNINNINNIKIIQKAISDTNKLLSTNDNIEHCSFIYGNPGSNGNIQVESACNVPKYYADIGFNPDAWNRCQDSKNFDPDSPLLPPGFVPYN